MTVGDMGQTLFAEPVVVQGSISELERGLATYEIAYGMTTVEFLQRYADANDPLADVEDAELWYEWHSTLVRLREEGEAPPGWCGPEPGNQFEGSKEPSNILYGPREVYRRDWRHDRSATAAICRHDLAGNS